MTIIQVSSFINQRFGVLSTTQRIDYFWTLGYVRVKNVCFVVVTVFLGTSQNLSLFPIISFLTVFGF